MQCEHIFVLISGIRDTTLQPECSKVKCKAEGERWLRSQRLLPAPSTALVFEKVKGNIDVACARVPKMSQETMVQLDEQWRQAVGASGSPTLSARQMLEEERESFTITDAMEYLRDDSPAFSSAYVGVGAGIGAIGSFKTKKSKPKWSAEVNPIQQEMWNVLTVVMCLGNFFELDPAFLPWVYLLTITLPCTDFSTGGSQRGDQGDTGWMYLAVMRQVLAMPKLPEVVEIETADGIMTTNNGRELREATALLETKYVVKVRKIKAAGYGSIRHRMRVVLVCVLKTSTAANMFEMPTPTWGTHRTACARDVAVEDDVALLTMEDKHIYKGYLPESYDVKNGNHTPEPKPKHVQLMKLGRWAPGMGHSNYPHLALSLDGAPNGPTGYVRWGRSMATNGFRVGRRTTLASQTLFQRLLQYLWHKLHGT